MRRLDRFWTGLAAVLVATMAILVASPAHAATITRSAEFAIPANASGYAVVKMSTGDVACEITATFTLNGKTETHKSNGPVTEFEVRYDYANGREASTVLVTATCEYDDDVYSDPALQIFDPFLVPDEAAETVDDGLLPGTGGSRLLLLVAGLALAVGGGYAAYRLRDASFPRG